MQFLGFAAHASPVAGSHLVLACLFRQMQQVSGALLRRSFPHFFPFRQCLRCIAAFFIKVLIFCGVAQTMFPTSRGPINHDLDVGAYF